MLPSELLILQRSMHLLHPTMMLFWERGVPQANSLPSLRTKGNAGQLIDANPSTCSAGPPLPCLRDVFEISSGIFLFWGGQQ